MKPVVRFRRRAALMKAPVANLPAFMKSVRSILVLAVIGAYSLSAADLHTDLLIVGGTESGWAAAIQAARMGVNPRNPSEKVQIKAANVPKFSAGSVLKKAVN